jgi:hypothetical protein
MKLILFDANIVEVQIFVVTTSILGVVIAKKRIEVVFSITANDGQVYRRADN